MPHHHHLHHHHPGWHHGGGSGGGSTRWRRRALLGVGVVAALVLAANVALLMPLMHGQEADGGGQFAGAAAVTERGFLESFDSDGNGVLDEFEFQKIVAVSVAFRIWTEFGNSTYVDLERRKMDVLRRFAASGAVGCRRSSFQSLLRAVQWPGRWHAGWYACGHVPSP